MKTKTEIQKKIDVQNNSPAQLIRDAVSGGADLEKLKGLLDLQERWEANEAKKAYHRAMADFKANPPKIEKDRKVSFSTNAGKTSYNHASLSNVTDKINKELSRCGLSASWRTQQNGTISVTCRITHEKGHYEETTLTAPADSSGSKNAIQQIGSTITYLERYTLLALTGLATYEQDDDAKAIEPIEYVDFKQASKIRDRINELKIDEDKFVKYLGIENVEKMPKSILSKAETALDEKAKKMVKS